MKNRQDYLLHIWHPYTQMKDAPLPRKIVKGEGAILWDEDGNEIIDAVSSWWVNVHGHAQPYIAQKIAEQAAQLEQVIFAGFTHEPALRLAEKLLHKLPPNQQKVFFSDNGSTAVEVALKMAIQYFKNKGIEGKNKIIAFQHSYHGDTLGAMSVSERSAFTASFSDYMFDVEFLPAPYPGSESESISKFEAFLNIHSQNVAAFIYEPLIQGSAGMLMYKANELNTILKLMKHHKIICIADEVMTGFYRTGTFFASQQCEIKPDIICLSKGLTGGFMPLGITTATQPIFQSFLGEWETKTLFHGHSFTANPLSCAAALASLELFEQEPFSTQYQKILQKQQLFYETIKKHPALRETRIQGTIVALEIKSEGGYFSTTRNKIYNYFLERGILLRPLGNIIYILPPYCISEQQLDKVYLSIQNFLDGKE